MQPVLAALVTFVSWVTKPFVRAANAVAEMLAVFYRALARSWEGFVRRTMAFRSNQHGSLAIGALALIISVVGGIVVFLILSNLADPFFTALGALLTSFIDVELGSNAVANTTEVIIESFAYLVGIGGALFLVGYALRASGVGRKG